MKKLSSLAFVLLLAATSGIAQEFYINAGIGYAFPQAGQTIDGTGSPYNGTMTNSTYATTYNLKNTSFSAGNVGTIGVGYLFTDHVGVELNASFNFSGKSYTFTTDNVNYGGYQATESVVEQAKTDLILMPSLILQTGGDHKLNLYTKFGLALPVSTKITEDEVLYVATLPQTDDYTFKIKSSFSLGFTGAAGVKYRVNDKMSVWGELSLLSLSPYIKEADLTGLTSNGYTIPLDSVTSPHTYKYSKNVTVDSSQTKQPAYSQPFSNVGIKVGVCFTLSKKRHTGRHSDDDGLIDNKKPFKRR